MRNKALRGVLLLAAALAFGCRQDMHDQPRYEPLEASAFFRDGRASRQPVIGTVARGELREDAHFYTGYVNGEPAPEFPFAIDRAAVMRGRERFEIYCAPCHGVVGDGWGPVVWRGFTHPPTYHSERLRSAPPGHFYNVITNGYGDMYSFNDRIPPADRWMIVSYIRALQYSQSAPMSELPATMLTELRAEGVE